MNLRGQVKDDVEAEVLTSESSEDSEYELIVP